MPTLRPNQILEELRGFIRAVGVYWARPTTGVQTNVTAAAASAAAPDVIILRLNNTRSAASLYNDSAAILYLLLSDRGAASTTNYSLQVPPNGYYEVPFGYTGQIRGVWSSTTGTLRVTEFTS